jgi:hypothetical protein
MLLLLDILGSFYREVVQGHPSDITGHELRQQLTDYELARHQSPTTSAIFLTNKAFRIVAVIDYRKLKKP